MTRTARKHFDDDISRAETLLALANDGENQLGDEVNRDLRLAAVAMAVGAMDAYFCDAYADCLTKRLQSAKDGPKGLPESYGTRKIPAAVLVNLFEHENENWSLRMAARDIMDKESVLDISKVTGLFNPVLPQERQLWPEVMEPLIARDRKTLTGTTRVQYDAIVTPKDRKKAREAAAGEMKKRLQETIQYRHDWVHNCGRPKSAVKALKPGAASQRISEVRAVVEAVDDHLQAYREV